MKIKKKLSLTSYCYLLPCMLVFAVFLFYPFVKTVYLSLFKTNKYGQAKLFVGLENYTDLLTSASFQNSLKVTMIYVVIVVLGSMFLGLVTAVLCNKAFPGIRVFSTAYALPMAIASSSAAMIFKIMLNPSIGIVNKLLGTNINWFNDPKTALICVAVLTAWLNSGINFFFCIFLQVLEILMSRFMSAHLWMVRMAFKNSLALHFQDYRQLCSTH